MFENATILEFRQIFPEFQDNKYVILIIELIQTHSLYCTSHKGLAIFACGQINEKMSVFNLFKNALSRNYTTPYLIAWYTAVHRMDEKIHYSSVRRCYSLIEWSVVKIGYGDYY